MATGILGLGSSGASGLNQELLDKLREAERTAKVEPIEDSINEITKEDGESATLANIVSTTNEFLDILSSFDLFSQDGVGAFEQKAANVSGDSVVFDAADVSKISEGTTSVFIEQLAKKDVFQTDSFADSEDTIAGTSASSMITLSQPGKPVYQSDVIVSSTDIIDAAGGTITINVDGVDEEFTINSDTTYRNLIDEINAKENLSATLTIEGRLSISHSDKETDISISDTLTSDLGISLGEKYSLDGLTYEQLATNINNNSSYNASIENVGDNLNRIVIKSSESGLENAINIQQTDIDLGLNEAANHTVSAQNLKATVDGIDYDVSSNVIVVGGGLKITAVEENQVGEFSSISIEKDVSTIEPIMEELVAKYNTLIETIDAELYSSESTIEDKSTLRTIVDEVKSKLFDSYGPNSDLNIFNFGFEIDKSGVLSLDSTTFNERLENNIEGLSALFVGTAEDEGLGTQLTEYIDSLDSIDGLFTKYEENIDSRKEALELEKEEAEEALDNTYSLMAAQFASYSAIITQYENQFSSLQLMIEQSTA